MLNTAPMHDWLRPLHRWSLATRIALISLGLLLVVLAAGWVVVQDSITVNARRELRKELVQGETVLRRLLTQRAQTLEQAATLLAADWGFRDAVRSEDRETLVSALENSGERIGASFVGLLGTNLQVTAHGEAAEAERVLALLPKIAPTLARQRQLVSRVGRQAWQFVMVPLKAPVVIGWVVIGFPLDRAAMDDVAAVTSLPVALVSQPESGARRTTASSALGVESISTLDSRGPLDLAALAGNDDELALQGQRFLARHVALQDDITGQVKIVLLGSVDAALAPYRSLSAVLGLIGVLGVVLFATGSVMTARRLARPLHRLVAASEQLAAGEYDRPLADRERGDEIGELARAFDHMRMSVATQRDEIRQLAFWDRLTGLPNRVQFRDTVAAFIAQPQAPSVAVLMLDLDRFKHVNDVLGYAQGDRLLQAVALRLRHAVKSTDLVARLGGDEFAVLLENDLDAAELVAERIARSFEQPLALDDQLVDLSAGIGIAVWPQHADGADLLLSRAEVAMYAAKRRTASALVYDPAIDSASAQTLSLLSELRRATDGGELRLYLQPKLRLHGDGPAVAVGAEALVRWQHPQRGLVPPMQFIPFAEQTGFIRRLTLWMFEAAARQQRALRALGVQRVSVNLSTRDLLDLDLPDKLAALLADHGASADGFCLEITESAIMDDPQRAEATLNRLAAAGFKLSIDDFGTGYSSLAYLKRLPVHELKIDKSFVMAMERDADDAKIVRSTIDLAHNLGLTVVAEGVENAAIAQALAELHCDEAQGYHYARPMPLDDFCAWAQQHRSSTSAPTTTATA